ncbi:MAG: hypothetical protein WCC64_22200, partial [Aliidongia sp.]
KAAEAPERRQPPHGQQLRLDLVEAMQIVAKLDRTIEQAPPAQFELDMARATAEQNLFDPVTETEDRHALAAAVDVEDIVAIGRAARLDRKDRRIRVASPEDRGNIGRTIG